MIFIPEGETVSLRSVHGGANWISPYLIKAYEGTAIVVIALGGFGSESARTHRIPRENWEMRLHQS